MSKTGTAAGRPTDAELTQRILAETRTQLAEEGYAALRIDRIVKAVGCGKSAVYRRYPSKLELAAAALLEMMSPGNEPDTGDVSDDLLAHALQNQELQSHPESRALALVVFSPEIFPLIWDSFLVRRRDAGLNILHRAIARGEVPADVASDIILDTIAGLTFYHQSVKGHVVTPDEYRAVIEALIHRPPRRNVAATQKDAP